MSALLTWRERADRDMVEHVRYLSERSPVISERFVASVLSACDLLCSSPELGTVVSQEPLIRAWSIGGFRNYVLLFRGSATNVDVLRLLHGSQDWQSAFLTTDYRRLI